MSKKRPNIIFIQNDHQAYYRWGWDDHTQAQRPNFDKLAGDGVSFGRAYCATPLCGPTRRTMLTGLYAHTHGQHHNYTDPAYDHEVYLKTLTDSGYRNYYFGKWHAGPGAAKEHGADGFSYTDYSNPYTKPEYKDYLKRYNLPQAVHRIRGYYDIPEIRERGDWAGCVVGEDYQCKANWCGEHAIGVTTTPKETHESFFLATLACEQLEKIAAEKSDQPFSLRLDFWGPHQPHFPTQEFLDMYQDLGLSPYGSFASDLEGKPAAYFRERSAPFGQEDNLIIPSPVEWDKWQEIVKYCYAHISMIDAAGGMVLEKLKELNLDQDTLIVWTTDHGDALASHGGHFDKGSFMSEEVMRIPLAMKWEGVIPAGQVRDELVCTVDFPVTLLDAAGLTYTQNSVHGRSLLPLAIGKNETWREDLVCETHGHGYGQELQSRMIVHQDWKYIATYNEKHELYNLAEDPFELTNLIDDGKYEETILEMRRRLMRWQEETQDHFTVL